MWTERLQMKITEILDDLGESFYPLHEYPDQPIYTDRNKEAIAEARQALHAATIAVLPEPYDMEYVVERNIGGTSIAIAEGFNEALDQMKAAIDELYEVKE